MPAPCTQGIDSLLAAFEDRFHAAIGSIPDPTGHASGQRFAATALAEEDTLDVAADNHTTSDHASAV
jgi:hypothetical protein